jgi:hypothetical protein
MTFLLKTSETNKFLKKFCEVFFILKNIFCLRHYWLIFVQNKVDLLSPQAVWIRVKKLWKSKKIILLLFQASSSLKGRKWRNFIFQKSHIQIQKFDLLLLNGISKKINKCKTFMGKQKQKNILDI